MKPNPVLAFFAKVLPWLTLSVGVAILVLIASGVLPANEERTLCVMAEVVSGVITAFSVILIDIRKAQERSSLDHEGLKSDLEDALATVTASGDVFLKERGDLGNMVKRISEAKSVDVCGMSLRGNINDNFDAYQTMLSNGGRCCFALVDPEGDAPDIIAKKYDGNRNGTEKYRQTIRNSIDRIRKLEARYPGQVSLSIADHVPSTSIVIINKERVHEMHCFVEVYTYSVEGYRSRPHMHLMGSNSPKWCEFFAAQFDKIVEMGEKV